MSGHIRWLHLLFIAITVPMTVTVLAEPRTLHAKPNRCIALHQGQECFQKLNFTWLTPKSGHYCLFQRNQSPPIICWKGDELMRYRHKFKSKKDEEFYILDKEKNIEIHSTQVIVAWVYKSSKKISTGWRLF